MVRVEQQVFLAAIDLWKVVCSSSRQVDKEDRSHPRVRVDLYICPVPCRSQGTSSAQKPPVHTGLSIARHISLKLKLVMGNIHINDLPGAFVEILSTMLACEQEYR